METSKEEYSEKIKKGPATNVANIGSSTQDNKYRESMIHQKP